MITEIYITEGTTEIQTTTVEGAQTHYENKAIELTPQDKAAIIAILTPYL